MISEDKGANISRRESILSAAREVFNYKGFHGATTSEISQKAGVAEGTIFRYFKTKKELLLAVFEPLETAWAAEFIRGAAEQEDEDTLRFYLKKQLYLVKENFELFKIFFYESQFHPELREKLTNKVVQKTLVPVESYLEEQVKEGKYREIDIPTAARALFGMLAVFIAWEEVLQAEDHIKFDEVEVVERIIDIFLHGVKK